MHFYISDSESKIYQVQFTRAELSTGDEVNNLRQAILESRTDICRVKINATDKDAIGIMDAIGFPYQLYNINYFNEVKLNDKLLTQLTWAQDYTYEQYSVEKKNLLKSLTEQIIGEKTWVNYHSQIAGKIITKAKEIEATQEFICGFDPKINPGKKAWFLKFRDEYIGFFSAIEMENSFHGILYGIVPQFKGHGHSKVIYKMMLRICADHNFEAFTNDIGVLNLPSQKSAASQFMVPEKVNLHFEIYSFLSMATKEQRTSTISFNTADELNLYHALFSEITTNLPIQNLKTHFYLNEPVDPDTEYRLKISIPEKVDNLTMAELLNLQTKRTTALLYAVKN